MEKRKKSFFTKLIDKIDKKLEKESKDKKCCCCLDSEDKEC